MWSLHNFTSCHYSSFKNTIVFPYFPIILFVSRHCLISGGCEFVKARLVLLPVETESRLELMQDAANDRKHSSGGSGSAGVAEGGEKHFYFKERSLFKLQGVCCFLGIWSEIQVKETSWFRPVLGHLCFLYSWLLIVTLVPGPSSYSCALVWFNPSSDRV